MLLNQLLHRRVCLMVAAALTLGMTFPSLVCAQPPGKGGGGGGGGSKPYRLVTLSTEAGTAFAMNEAVISGSSTRVELVGEVGFGPCHWSVTATGSSETKATTLLALPGDCFAGSARDINSAGMIVGTGVSLTGGVQALLLLDYANFVYLWDIYLNDSGDVMAFAGEPIDGMHGTRGRTFVWPASGGMINLSDLNNGNSVSGNDIATVDGKLQVVGYAYKRSGRFAFLFNNGQLLNINNLVKASNWELWLANGVSNAGHICGRGRLTIKNKTQHHGYVLIKQ